MKTIKQIADEIGVTKQAIQKRISKEPLYTSIQPYISTVGGTKYIGVDGVKLIKSAYSERPTTNVADNIPSNQQPTIDNEVYSILRETIATLREQLEVKDNQIKGLEEINKELLEVNKNLSSSINNDRRNELAETIIDGTKLIEDRNPPQKKGFFSRVFRFRGFK